MQLSRNKLLLYGSILVFVPQANTARSKSYFVAPDGSNVTGTGTPDQPFATIEKASTFVGPGDTILLRGGVYHQADRINPNAKGTADKPIVVRNYPGEQPVFDGTEVALNNNDALLFIGRWHNPGCPILSLRGLRSGIPPKGGSAITRPAT